MKTPLLTLALVAASMSLSSAAQAGTWTCATGLDGKIIYGFVIKGDEQANFAKTAIVSVAGLPGGSFSVRPDTAEPGELVRVLIGAEDPRSKTRLRIGAEPTAPNVYPAHTLLVNFGIKQEMEGTCTYAP